MDPQSIDHLIAASPGGWDALWSKAEGGLLDLGQFTVELVDRYSDGEFDYLDMVVRVIRREGGVQYFRKAGCWDAGWGGNYWDGSFREVFPQEKTVVVYVDKVS